MENYGMIKVFKDDKDRILVAGGDIENLPPGYTKESWLDVMKLVSETLLKQARLYV